MLCGTIRFLAGATGEVGYEVTLLVGAVFGVRGAGGVGVEEVLGDEGELGEDGAVPSVGEIN